MYRAISILTGPKGFNRDLACLRVVVDGVANSDNVSTVTAVKN
jgi:hypothetical protein